MAIKHYPQRVRGDETRNPQGNFPESKVDVGGYLPTAMFVKLALQSGEALEASRRALYEWYGTVPEDAQPDPMASGNYDPADLAADVRHMKRRTADVAKVIEEAEAKQKADDDAKSKEALREELRQELKKETEAKPQT